MAAIAAITRDDRFFKGTTRQIRFKPWATLPTSTAPGVPLDATTLGALAYALAPARLATPAITKTTGDGIAIEGAYNADPALHAQWIVVSIDAADTAALAAGAYVHALRVTASGAEAVLADGPVVLLEPVAVPA